MKFIIKILKSFIQRYEIKHPEYEKPIFICNHIDTRNRCKNDRYKIPENQPQCPIYKDNRCCGGCKLAAKCNHCVNCGCFGFTYAQMGGNDKGYYMHKASKFYPYGRIKNKKFDWEYYKKKSRYKNKK